MFGKQKASNPAKDFDLNDIDRLLNSSLEDVDDDIDMNDPELLKQLREMSSTTTEALPKKEPNSARKMPQSVQNMDIDFNSYTALAQGDEDIEVEFNECDMQDPDLLNELSKLSSTAPQEEIASLGPEAKELINMGFTQAQALKALNMFDNNLERAANYLFDLPPADDKDTEPHHPPRTSLSDEMEHEEDEENDEQQESIDPEFWKKKAEEYQKMALTAKREGDKKKAVSLLRESKMFNQKYQDLQEIYQRSEPQPATRNASSKSTESQENTLTPLPLSEPVIASTPAQPSSAPQQQQPTLQEAPVTADNSQQILDLLGKIISLQKQYKEAALHYKELGNLAVAKQMVRTSKELLQTGIRLKNGEIENPAVVRLPGEPDLSLGDGKIRQVDMVLRGPNPTSFEQIEAQLTYQMNVCHNLSVQLASSTRYKPKSSKTLMNSQQQDAYAKAEQALSADLVSLHATKPNIPPLHYEQVDYTYKNLLDTIPENMMEFKIIKATSLPTLDISAKLEPFVAWNFGGWPPENTAQAAMNRGETPIAAGINPQYDFNVQIPISRTNRLFQRYLQRKKLTVEVYHNNYAYGLFKRPVLLGKLVIPMERLLTKASINGTFDLLDGSKRKTGGKIEIEVNLREPLTGEDIAKRSERWLVLDAFGSTVSECLSLANLTVGGPQRPPMSSTPAQSEVGLSNVIEQAPAISPVQQQQHLPPAASLPEQQQKQADKDMPANSDLEAAEEEFNSVDNIVSNMVMEHELSLVNSKLASKSTDLQKEDLLDRKQSLEIKMNMLVVQVQTGILDMSTYLENVQKRMEADRRLALVFKKNNRLDLAKAALTRKKIMQDEVDEAKTAMED
ncbi:hypothetical protein [Parasitella parasitica]|uniref:UBA domain-containing protein n=1 Tax=Parasitella parasitica TaxID=35722 RepID=A0A0B7MQ14_9FUNG|nr:hypothetical protein [Parasitella parasitica]